ncbi:MAG: hypothetical protein GC159_04975 [Phycisphaera sp.]|nr:hypothetical protein [Phycisphaera sp.]
MLKWICMVTIGLAATTLRGAESVQSAGFAPPTYGQFNLVPGAFTRGPTGECFASAHYTDSRGASISLDIYWTTNAQGGQKQYEQLLGKSNDAEEDGRNGSATRVVYSMTNQARVKVKVERGATIQQGLPLAESVLGRVAAQARPWPSILLACRPPASIGEFKIAQAKFNHETIGHNEILYTYETPTRISPTGKYYGSKIILSCRWQANPDPGASANVARFSGLLPRDWEQMDAYQPDKPLSKGYVVSRSRYAFVYYSGSYNSAEDGAFHGGLIDQATYNVARQQAAAMLPLVEAMALPRTAAPAPPTPTPTPTPPPANAPSIARVTYVGGTVTVTRPNAGPVPLNTDDKLAPGDIVATGRDGLVRIEITVTTDTGAQRSDVIKLAADTRVTVTQTGTMQTPTVVQIEGVVDWAHLPTIPGPPPNAILGQSTVAFRGTHVQMVSRAGRYDDVRVVEGAVVVASRANPGASMAVNAGQKLHVRADGGLGVPVALDADEARQFTRAMESRTATIDEHFGDWQRHAIADQGCWIDLPWNWQAVAAPAGVAAMFTATSIDPTEPPAGQVFLRVLKADPSVHIRTEVDRFLDKSRAARPDLEVVTKRGDMLAGQRAAWTVVKMNQPGGPGKLVVASWMLRDNDRLLVISAQATNEAYLANRELMECILSTFRLDAPHHAP